MLFKLHFFLLSLLQLLCSQLLWSIVSYPTNIFQYKYLHAFTLIIMIHPPSAVLKVLMYWISVHFASYANQKFIQIYHNTLDYILRSCYINKDSSQIHNTHKLSPASLNAFKGVEYILNSKCLGRWIPHSLFLSSDILTYNIWCCVYIYKSNTLTLRCMHIPFAFILYTIV